MTMSRMSGIISLAGTVVRAVDGIPKILASVFGNPYFITVNPLCPSRECVTSFGIPEIWLIIGQIFASYRGGGSLHFNVLVGGDPLRLSTEFLPDAEDSTIVSSFV